MCIAIYTAPGHGVMRDEFDNSWDNNPDGGGFAYIDFYDELHVVKSMNKRDLWGKYQEALETFGDYSPFVLHFRIGTSGVQDITNVHPFHLNGNTVIAHNGIISGVPYERERNDTRVFIEDYLTQFPVTWPDSPELVQMVEDFIGPGSKFVVLTKDPMLDFNAYILNERQGLWDDKEEQNIWYSNTSYAYSKRQSYSLTPTSKTKVTSKAKEKDEKKATTRDRHRDELDMALRWGVCVYCGEQISGQTVCWNCEWCLECDAEVFDNCKCYVIGPDSDDVNDIPDLHSMTDAEFERFMALH